MYIRSSCRTTRKKFWVDGSRNEFYCSNQRHLIFSSFYFHAKITLKCLGFVYCVTLLMLKNLRKPELPNFSTAKIWFLN